MAINLVVALEFIGHIHKLCEFLRCHRASAFRDPVAGMVPIGVAKIQPDANLTIPEIGRAKVTLRVAVYQHRLLLNAADFDQ